MTTPSPGRPGLPLGREGGGAHDPPPLPDLPIRAVLPRLVSALATRGSAVLAAPPGAGKTTLVPLALLEAGWLGGRKILMLEPRRIAARAAARRMAALLGERGVGGTVGYRVRRDVRVGRRTRIEVVTEGILTRMLQGDPALEEVGVVIFDEFHERSLHADLGLALALESRAHLREDLRLLVMSATLDTAPVARLLGEAPVLHSEGQVHPVETRWRRSRLRGPVERAVAAAVVRALDESAGDVLVFLPGAREIRRTRELLDEMELPRGTDIHRLHGSLSAEAQDRALAPAPRGRRKVVLASAVAETSLTIDGITAVVDSGLMRVPRFDPGTGMTRLETVRVTRDSADQRRGRAGRQGPGLCLRLWTRGEDRGLVPRRSPEILEADLTSLLTELVAWGSDPYELAWLDPPPRAALAQARELLEELEVVGPDGELTAHGRRAWAMGRHPRIGHMLQRAVELRLGAQACEVAALIEARDPLRAEGRLPDADLRLRLDALRRPSVPLPPGHRIDRRGLDVVRREAAHLRGALHVAREGAAVRRAPPGASGRLREAGRASARDGAERREGAEEPAADPQAAGVLAAFAYPDRIGRRREGRAGRFLLRGGRGAALPEGQSLETAEWIVAVEVEGRGREARIVRAAPLTDVLVERHFGPSMEEAEEITWDEKAARVRAARVRRLGAIEVSRAPLAEPEPERVAAVLLSEIRARGLDVLPWCRETVQLRERMHFLHHLDPKRWPDCSEEVLVDEMEGWLLPFLAGFRSLEDLRELELGEALLLRAPAGGREQLERDAPSHLEVPSGSRIAVDYGDPSAPALAVRLQEVFGLAETPRVGRGRVPLTMRLLSPAHRPVQVTRDLSSFWADAYFEVRKEMRGRYPKHPWPEDPLEAAPTRGVRRPRRGWER